MQTREDKAKAIATLIWLLPDHYAMLQIGRSGIQFRKEISQTTKPWWVPRMPERFEDWPLGEIERWYAERRNLSKRYRLWNLGLALDRLRNHDRRLAAAVCAQCAEFPPPNWWHPGEVMEWCRQGLLWMADDIPGDMPWFQASESPVETVARDQRIREMSAEGIPQKRIAAELCCSAATIRAVLSGGRVVRGRVVPSP